MILERGIIPPNTNFERVNPRIDTTYLNIKVRLQVTCSHTSDTIVQFPLQATQWPVDGLRRASVNSFGYGGSNAHVVLDDAAHYLRERGLAGNHCTVHAQIDEDPYVASRTWNVQEDHACRNPEFPSTKLLVWSAADKEGLSRLAMAYADHFACEEFDIDALSTYLNNLAYTLCIRRSFLPWRAFVVANSTQTLKALTSEMSPAMRCVSNPRLGFVFTGQGAQWARMGSELLAYPGFKRSLRDAEEYFRALGAEWLLIGFISSKILERLLIALR